jgi:hypothetical protein
VEKAHAKAQRREESLPQAVNLDHFEFLFAPLREILFSTTLAENRNAVLSELLPGLCLGATRPRFAAVAVASESRLESALVRNTRILLS